MINTTNLSVEPGQAQAQFVQQKAAEITADRVTRLLLELTAPSASEQPAVP